MYDLVKYFFQQIQIGIYLCVQKRPNTNTNIFGKQKRLNTNINIFGLTKKGVYVHSEGSREYEYKYKYLSHTESHKQTLQLID